MKKFIVIFFVIIVAVFAGGIFGKTIQKEDTRLVKSAEEVIIPDTPTPTQKPLAKPKEVSIPKLNVQTPIEYVGNASDGNMDTPQNDMQVAWYEPGFIPGAKGNSVLAGHFDRKDGGPAVFYNLNKLEAGDEIIVTDANAKPLMFTVVDKTKYPVADFPVSKVFGPSDKHYLNLITCEGVFDPAKKLYSDRLVVRAELQEE